MTIEEKLEIAIFALREITEGKGRYDMDKFLHAVNTIADMKDLAKEALLKIEK